MNRKPTNIVIVDAFSSGNVYAPLLHAKGHSCIHVQSQVRIPKAYARSFNANDFSENFVNRSFASTIKHVRSLKPSHVIAGSELGVTLADQLSEKLDLPTNGMKFSPARRDKFLMIEALKKKKLRHILTKKTKSLKSILKWKDDHHLEEIVLKPQQSAGTDGVFFCASESEITKAFKTIFGKKNRLGFRNDYVLAQELIKGTEHVVNSVSINGTAFVCGVWAYQKKRVSDGATIYDVSRLLNPNAPPHSSSIQQLVVYNQAVLTALGIRHGCTHAEIMVTKKGPVLIEVGARPDGYAAHSVNKIGTGFNQVELDIETRLNPDCIKPKSIYSIQKHACIVSLISHQEGIIKGLPNIARFKALPSFVEVFFRFKPGDQISKTRDLFTSPGTVDLAHADEDQLKKDQETIRRWEIGGLFELER